MVRFPADQSFPMQIGFTPPLSQEILAHELATQQIQQPDAFYVTVWNVGSKDIVLKIWQEYSADLPPENFHSQKDFLQEIADQFKTHLPRHMLNTNIVDILHNEYYRLKNDCPQSRFPGDLDEHIVRLGSLILRVQRDNRPRGTPGPAPQHYNCRSGDIPIVYGSGTTSVFRQAMERITEGMRQRLTERVERDFRNRVYGELPEWAEPRIEHVPETLTRESIELASRYLWHTRENPIFSHDNRWRDTEDLQRRNPSAKLGEIDQRLMNRGHKPSLDHEESKVMPGMSKGVAGYIMLNDKLKTMLDGLCDLNTWKP